MTQNLVDSIEIWVSPDPVDFLDRSLTVRGLNMTMELDRYEIDSLSETLRERL
jgi:hypothetical protein